MLSAGAALLFLFFDGTIRKFIIMQEREARGFETKEKHIAKLNGELRDLRNNEDNYDNKAIFKKIEKKLLNRIKRAHKARY
jgi:hypothetical protein